MLFINTVIPGGKAVGVFHTMQKFDHEYKNSTLNAESRILQRGAEAAGETRFYLVT